MKLTNVEKKENFQVELSIIVEKDEFEAGIQAAYHKIKGSVNIPGFRKGKAPRKMIEKMYGVEVFYEDAIDHCYPAAYDAAVKEAGISPIAILAMTDATVEEGELKLGLLVQLKPELTVKAYKGLEAEKKAADVSDEDVQAELEKMAQRNSRQVTVDRAAKMGDSVKFDFKGFQDGVAFEGGEAEGYELMLGSGMFIPGFEEQIEGHVAGDEFDVDVTFPAEYQAEELAGKPAVFKCKLHEVHEIQKPELDDEFAKDVSEFDTLDEYKADMKSKMQAMAEQNADRAFEEALMGKLVEGLEGDIPEVMIEKEIDFIVNDYSYQIAMQSGMKFDDYLSMSGMNIDMFRSMFKATAETRVKTRLALEAVVRAEGIEVTEEEMEKSFADMAAQYGMEVEAVKAQINAADLKMDLAVSKAVEVVKAGAKVAKAKKARKPAAKKTKKAEAEEVSTEKAEDNE